VVRENPPYSENDIVVFPNSLRKLYVRYCYYNDEIQEWLLLVDAFVSKTNTFCPYEIRASLVTLFNIDECCRIYESLQGIKLKVIDGGKS
jgi:hypothetical protein